MSDVGGHRHATKADGRNRPSARHYVDAVPGDDIVQRLQAASTTIARRAARGAATALSGFFAATPAWAASSSPGIEAWSTLAVFAALVVLACIVVRNGTFPGAFYRESPQTGATDDPDRPQ